LNKNRAHSSSRMGGPNFGYSLRTRPGPNPPPRAPLSHYNSPLLENGPPPRTPKSSFLRVSIHRLDSPHLQPSNPNVFPRRHQISFSHFRRGWPIKSGETPPHRGTPNLPPQPDYPPILLRSEGTPHRQLGSPPYWLRVFSFRVWLPTFHEFFGKSHDERLGNKIPLP